MRNISSEFFLFVEQQSILLIKNIEYSFKLMMLFPEIFQMRMFAERNAYFSLVIYVNNNFLYKLFQALFFLSIEFI